MALVAVMITCACTFSPAPVRITADADPNGDATPEPACVRALAAGGIAGLWGHTCAARDDGRVMCFGSNTQGQLGDGTTTDRAVPEPVMAPPGIVALTASSSHTCGRNNAGELYCWGANGVGQLGTGNTSDYEAVPQLAAPGGTVGPVAAGEGFTCAVVAGGTVKCWGEGISGQLGDGMGVTSPTPVTVTGLTGVVDVAAGEDHACARLAIGEIWCWGRGDRGQLGDGMTVQRNAPVQVTGIANAADLALGWEHGCTLEANEVFCWGENGQGQLGVGNNNPYATPQPVTFQTSIDGDALAAGADHSCVLTADMRVICWGANEHGQLGIASDAPNQLAPLDAAGQAGWVDLAAGGAHSCARRLDDASVWCWGEGAFGQLGDGGFEDRRVPVRATGLCVAIP